MPDSERASDVILSPEEIEALNEHHANCALTIRQEIVDGERVTIAEAEGGEPPFELTLTTNALGNVDVAWEDVS